MLFGCTKFEGSENQWTSRIDNILCKDTFNLNEFEGSRVMPYNYDVVSDDWPYCGFINGFKVKFDKDGTCQYLVSVNDRWEDASPPDESIKYSGSFNGVRGEYTTGKWRLTGKKKKNLEILFDQESDDWVLYLIDELKWYKKEAKIVLHYYDESYSNHEVGAGIEEIKLTTE